MELRKRRRGQPTEPQNQSDTPLPTFLDLVQGCQNLVVFTGAGISANSGMSMFTSRDGLYARARKQFKIQDGIRLFTYSFFKQRRAEVQAFFAQIYSEAQASRAAPGHHALAAIAEMGRIKRHYTLNIDGLAEVVGMSTWHHELHPTGSTVEMHGNIRQLVCPACFSVEPLTRQAINTMKEQKAIQCPSCAADELRFKVMLYDDDQGDCITPEHVFETLEEDLQVADCVLWVGISFEQSASVEYFRRVRQVLASQGRLAACPQAIINPAEEACFNIVSSVCNVDDLQLLDVRTTADAALSALAERMRLYIAPLPTPGLPPSSPPPAPPAQPPPSAATVSLAHLLSSTPPLTSLNIMGAAAASASSSSASSSSGPSLTGPPSYTLGAAGAGGAAVGGGAGAAAVPGLRACPGLAGSDAALLHAMGLQPSSAAQPVLMPTAPADNSQLASQQQQLGPGQGQAQVKAEFAAGTEVAKVGRGRSRRKGKGMQAQGGQDSDWAGQGRGRGSEEKSSSSGQGQEAGQGWSHSCSTQAELEAVPALLGGGQGQAWPAQVQAGLALPSSNGVLAAGSSLVLSCPQGPLRHSLTPDANHVTLSSHLGLLPGQQGTCRAGSLQAIAACGNPLTQLYQYQLEQLLQAGGPRLPATMLAPHTFLPP